MKLVDLETGQTMATQSFENPQRFAGTDVMARIRFDSENRGRLLQRVLTGYMVHAIESFPCDPNTVYEMAVAGNPTMRDLFFGLNVYTIGQRPYRSLTQLELLEGKRTTTSLSAMARRLRLPIHPAARVYGLPIVSSHVGADAAACLLAVGMARGERAIAVMDIGTNTELLVGHQGKIFCASCPAGPAFEGGGVSCGMPALEGAIERVALREDGSVDTSTVGGGAPVGICGSGLIDLLSELLRTERMNTLGRLDGESDHFVVDAARPILFHESDINELAQAKGANVAGLRIVLEQFGIDFSGLDRFYLAGGFARHLDVAAGRRIGFIPNLPEEKFVRIGNASLEGAVIALRSVRRRKELEERVKTITHVELETHPQFFDYFVDGCQFVPVETTVLEDGAGER
jgi:uncharacterized 2Fe-2S/4Fe-4S cluster protein (DUF4445 family)